jgi:hypothetical protein
MISPPHQSRPTENPPNLQPATVGEEELGGRDPTSRRTSMREASERPSDGLAGRHRPRSMRRSPAASPATPPSKRTQSTGSCAPARGWGPSPAQDRCATPHCRLWASPVPRPRPRPPRRRSPTRHVPRQQQQAGGNEDILSSATGPSSARCSKDVTTHQHRPGACPGRTRPVLACSWQPLPSERGGVSEPSQAQIDR